MSLAVDVAWVLIVLVIIWFLLEVAAAVGNDVACYWLGGDKVAF